jgi:exosome complex component RRP40
MTNEGCYGELRGGTVCRITSGLARELLQPQNVVLSELSRRVAFEVAIGVNGYLWIHSSRPQYTIVIQNAILNSSVLTDEQVRAMVQSLVYTVEKQLQKQKDAMEE